MAWLGALRCIPSGKWSRSRSEEALATCFSKGCTPVGCLEVDKNQQHRAHPSHPEFWKEWDYISSLELTALFIYKGKLVGKQSFPFGMLPVFQGRAVGFREVTVTWININYRMLKLPILYLWSRAWFHPSVVPSLCFSGKWSFVAQANFLEKKTCRLRSSV